VSADHRAFQALQARLLGEDPGRLSLTVEEAKVLLRLSPAWRQPKKQDGPRKLTAWGLVRSGHSAEAPAVAPSLAKQLVLREMCSRALNALSSVELSRARGEPSDPEALAFAMAALNHALDVTTAEDPR